MLRSRLLFVMVAMAGVTDSDLINNMVLITGICHPYNKKYYFVGGNQMFAIT